MALPVVYTKSELARELGHDVRTVQRMIDRKEIKPAAQRPDGRALYSKPTKR
jgi:hypothetical protein